MTHYAEPRFAIDPLSTDRGVAGATPAVTLHTATCSLVSTETSMDAVTATPSASVAVTSIVTSRHDARYFTTVVEAEAWIEAAPRAVVPRRQYIPRQEMS